MWTVLYPRWTRLATRADQSDVTINSQRPQGFLSGQNAPDRRARMKHINELKAMDDAYTADRAAKLDNLDATVSSRMAGSAYTPPDNASIAAIKAKTDRLQFSADDDVKATLDGEAVTASSVQDKTGYSLAADQSGVTVGAVSAAGQRRGQVSAEVDGSRYAVATTGHRHNRHKALTMPHDDAGSEAGLSRAVAKQPWRR